MAEAFSLVIQGEGKKSFLHADGDVRYRPFQEVGNPVSQRSKRMAQEDPENSPKNDMEFFTSRSDPIYEKNAVNGIMAFYTAVRDIQAFIDAGKF